MDVIDNITLLSDCNTICIQSEIVCGSEFSVIKVKGKRFK